tara:strand:+ start:587 stop:817 length:231 start_codon:yes stop_codon:yes gene_type:complete
LINNAPFLLLSIAVMAFAPVSGAANIAARAFNGSPVRMIVCAAALRGLSLFYSCGVTPLVSALLAIGVPLSGAMVF